MTKQEIYLTYRHQYNCSLMDIKLLEVECEYHKNNRNINMYRNVLVDLCRCQQQAAYWKKCMDRMGDI